MKQIARLATIVGLGVGIILLAGTAVAGPAGQQAAPEKEMTPGVNDFVVVEEMPVLLIETKPVYPEQARKNQIEGDVWVRALIGTDGVVQKAEITKESGKAGGFEEAALSAAYKNTYKPATSEGAPVAVWVAYKVSFKLTECPPGEKKGN